MTTEDTDQPSPDLSAWKRHRRKVGWVLVLFVFFGGLLMQQRGHYAKERTWELAARLGLSTDWKQWYAHQSCPEPEDNVACHPLFDALRRPGRGLMWDFGALAAEAKSGLPAGVAVGAIPQGQPGPFTDLLGILTDDKKHPLPPADVIAATTPMKRITDQVLEAAQRKGCNWRMSDPADFSDPSAVPFPSMSNMFETSMALTSLWKARTAAFLQQGDRVSAQREMLALLEWGRFWNGSDSLVMNLVSTAIEGITRYQVEPLLIHPAWTAADLVSFDKSLAQRDLPRSLFFGLRKEGCGLRFTEDEMFFPMTRGARGSTSRAWAEIGISMLPRALRYQNGLVLSEYMTGLIGAHYDPGTGLAQPAPWSDGVHPAIPTSIGPGNFLAAIAMPALSNVFESTVQAQTHINHQRVIIALRQYFLTQVTYPTQLAALKSELPTDRVTGEPIHYHFGSDAKKLQLWSANRSGKPGDDAMPPSPHATDWISLELNTD